VLAGPEVLAEAVRDLEQRGLLQYDAASRRHDLHPVVRGVAARGLSGTDLQRVGQGVVDFFSSASRSQHDQAQTLGDVASALNLVRTLVRLERLPAAITALKLGELDLALRVNLEAHAEMLAVLRPCFGRDWSEVHERVAAEATWLGIRAGNALALTGHYKDALAAYGLALADRLRSGGPTGLGSALRNVAVALGAASTRPAKTLQLLEDALALAMVTNDAGGVFRSHLLIYETQILLGWWSDADDTWRRLAAMGRDWPRYLYVPADIELAYAWTQYFQGGLLEEHLAAAAEAARAGHNRQGLREVHQLRGLERLDAGDWTAAAQSLSAAVALARERRIVDGRSEAALVLSKLRLGSITADEAREEALRLTGPDGAHRFLAMIWQAVGDLDRAAKEALAAYEQAWADGEPFVYRYDLTAATKLLGELGVAVPDLPPYDPAKDEPFPWEDDIRRVIDELTSERATDEEAPD
jgi:tetratricopeptide (TPR) repeat protein